MQEAKSSELRTNTLTVPNRALGQKEDEETKQEGRQQEGSPWARPPGFQPERAFMYF